MTGVLAGLRDAGVDPARADVVIGTSAGAIFGARLLAGEPARELYERQLAGADSVDLDVTLGQTLRFLWAALGGRDPERSVRRLGRAALKARTGPESDVYAALDPLLRGVEGWPDHMLRITAVDALTGALTAFDADSGVTLREAVAASCAVPVVWPPSPWPGAVGWTAAAGPRPTSTSRAAITTCWPSPRSPPPWALIPTPRGKRPSSPPKAPTSPS